MAKDMEHCVNMYVIVTYSETEGNKLHVWLKGLRRTNKE